MNKYDGFRTYMMDHEPDRMQLRYIVNQNEIYSLIQEKYDRLRRIGKSSDG